MTATVTTVLTAFTSFGLAAVSTWFAFERWIFSRHRGQKWLSDVLIEAKDRYLNPGVTWAQRGISVAVRNLKSAFKSTVVGVLSTSTCRSTETDDDDLEARVHGPPTTSRSQLYDPTSHRLSDVTAFMSEPSTPTSPLVPPTPLNSPVDQGSSSSFAAAPTTDPTTTVGKQLWKNALRNIRMSNALTLTQLRTAAPVIGPPLRRRTSSSSLKDDISDSRKKMSTSTSESVLFSRPRISTFVPKLTEMKVIHDLAAHSALVRHMQFSPDGQFLATSR